MSEEPLRVSKIELSASKYPMWRLRGRPKNLANKSRASKKNKMSSHPPFGTTKLRNASYKLN